MLESRRLQFLGLAFILNRLLAVAPSADHERTPGPGLVVVEAMKMQNELKASRAGRVLTVPAKEGATVAAGDVLATIG